jgi:hypothetical protein
MESETITPSAVPPKQTLHRRVYKSNKILTIANILYISFYYYKMPRQLEFAILRKPFPLPTFLILLSPAVITLKKIPEFKK